MTLLPQLVAAPLSTGESLCLIRLDGLALTSRLSRLDFVDGLDAGVTQVPFGFLDAGEDLHEQGLVLGGLAGGGAGEAAAVGVGGGMGVSVGVDGTAPGGLNGLVAEGSLLAAAQQLVVLPL